MRIKLFRFLFAILLPLPIILPVGAADREQKQAESARFLKDVQGRSDIRSAGDAPFRLVAQVEVASLESGKQPSDGKITFTWQSPEEWREEIAFPGFNEVRVAAGGKQWISRSLSYEPLRIYQLHQLMDIRSQWTLRAGESARDEKTKKQKNGVMRCVEVKGDKRPTRELCADAQSLLPLQNKPTPSLNPFIPSFEYSDYTPWGGRQFPRLMRAKEDNHLAVEVRVQELDSSLKQDPSLFVPPTEAIEWNWCENVEPAKLTDNPAPNYPESAKVNKQEGFVSLYALIGKDGLPRNLTPVRPAGADFNRSSISGVARWRYRPAMCGGNPIPFETIIDIAYTLRD